MIFRSLQSLVMICLSVAMVMAQTTSAVQQKTLLGFDREGSDRERVLEKQFDSFLKKENLREWMKRLTDLYKFRHENSDTGLNELIASVLSTPLPQP